MKIFVEQNGVFQDMMYNPLPLRKKITAINSKPDDGMVLTFGAFRDLIYPIGSIFMSTNNINPETFLGGTWKSKSGIISSGYTWERWF